MVRTLLIAVLLAGTSCLYGQSTTATQTLHLRVMPVSSLAIQGEPTLAIETATSGDAQLSSVDRSSRYRLSSNRPSLKMSAAMNEPLPDGMHLVMQVASRKGTSLGPVELSDASAPATVVAGISRGTEVDQEIAYTLLVDAMRVGPTSAKRTVIFTVTE